jgi:hypothetical protein
MMMTTTTMMMMVVKHRNNETQQNDAVEVVEMLTIFHSYLNEWGMEERVRNDGNTIFDCLREFFVVQLC